MGSYGHINTSPCIATTCAEWSCCQGFCRLLISLSPCRWCQVLESIISYKYDLIIGPFDTFLLIFLLTYMYLRLPVGVISVYACICTDDMLP